MALFDGVRNAIAGASLDHISFAPPEQTGEYYVADINDYRGCPVSALTPEQQALVPDGMDEVIYNVHTGNLILPEEWARGIRD